MIDDALREELSALIDGVLPEERAKELRRRIREEAELSREYAELERAVLALRALPRRGAPRELRAHLDASLRQPRARGRILRFGALAAAAAVLVAVGLALHVRGRGEPARFEATGEPPRDRQEEARDEAQSEADAKAPASAQPKSELKAARGATAKEGARDGNARLGAAKGEKKREEGDLLASVLLSREVRPGDRKAYLRQLGALGAEMARAHVLSVFGAEADLRDGRELLPEAPGGGPTLLATVLLEDREEADLVRKVLGAAPAGAAAALTVAEEAKDRLDAGVEGTPDDLRRIARWLALLDLSREDAMRPKVTVVDEAEAGTRAQEQAVRAAVVRLRYGTPPEPQPAESPPGK